VSWGKESAWATSSRLIKRFGQQQQAHLFAISWRAFWQTKPVDHHSTASPAASTRVRWAVVPNQGGLQLAGTPQLPEVSGGSRAGSASSLEGATQERITAGDQGASWSGRSSWI